MTDTTRQADADRELLELAAKAAPDREGTPLGVHWLGGRPYMLTSPPRSGAKTAAAEIGREHHG